MARDNSAKERHRRKLERKLGKRASYDRILIVSEGSKTEPQYFKEIRAAYRLHTANIEVQPSELGTQPVQVVNYARELFEHGNPHRKIRPQVYEQVYAVFDRDDHPSYFEALELAKSLDGKLRNDAKQPVAFHAIASVPCFELWLLLHYEEIQHSLHRDDVISRLRKYIPGYTKGESGNFEITRKFLDGAQARAQKLAIQGNAFDDTKPYTDINKLVALLLSLKT